MNGDWNDHQAKKYRSRETPKWKINTLLTDLLEKDEEITVYKNRLKELETAFYYNLELIAERDLELSVLERQLGSENEQLQELIRERNELEDLVRVINDRHNKKIKKLETKLSLKGEEIRDIQRESLAKIDTLKRLLDDVKHQQEEKISKMSKKFETQKKEMIKGHQEEMEEKEKYYLLEIDNLAGKLAQACIEKEELIKARENNENLLEDIKRQFLEKESRYLEEIRKKSVPSARKVSREVQCEIKPQVLEQKTQVEPETTATHSQTVQESSELEEYIEKLTFLQEQNEVLKYIVKDLKRNRDVGARPEEAGQPPGCECLHIRAEIDQISKKFESEINNLKKILEEENKFKTEEDALIQSLETSVAFLKDKLLLAMQEKLQNPQEEDIYAYPYNREIQNVIHVSLLEQKLTRKIDSFVSATEEENRKVHEKLDRLGREWQEKMEKHLKPQAEFKSENLLQRIRQEIQKLEDKIESDMKNIVRNNCEKNKCDKNLQTKAEFPENIFPRTSFRVSPEAQTAQKCNEFDGSVGLSYRNDLSPEKYISIFKCTREANVSAQARNRLSEHKGIRVTNNLVFGR